MTIEAQAADILRETEARLRKLTAEAASSGDYAAIIKVAAWAKTVSDLVKATVPLAAPPARIDSPRAVRQNSRKGKRGSEPQRRVAQTHYPRFLRRGDELIRIAWSKREKKEYQHRAPYAALKALVAAFAEAGKEGRVFATDQVLPIHDHTDGSEVPNYQAYVCIAWLKRTGLVDQHGRQGYSIPRLAEFEKSVESIWEKLPGQ